MKIGLTHTGNPEKHQFYVNWLKSGEDIEVVSLSADNNPNEIKDCDALVLSGGIDIHPQFYRNSDTKYPRAPETFNRNRDEFEIAAYQVAQDNHLPVLGICRGMQLINIIHQGTLIQNLDEETLNPHHIGNPDKSHEVVVFEETVLRSIVGDEKVAVNSAHHQAIDKLGDGLAINAISEDGVAEGIERLDKENKPFLLAIQWHPERMFRFQLENSNASKAMRDRFIQEIKKSMESK